MIAPYMRKWSISLLAIPFLVVINLSFTQGQGPKKITSVVTVEKKGNVWKATPGEIRDTLKTGNKYFVEWKAKGSDLILWFPRKNLFGQQEYYIANGDSLELEIKTTKKGRYPYSVFIQADESMAEGNSSPIIIID